MIEVITEYRKIVKKNSGKGVITLEVIPSTSVVLSIRFIKATNKKKETINEYIPVFTIIFSIKSLLIFHDLLFQYSYLEARNHEFIKLLKSS